MPCQCHAPHLQLLAGVLPVRLSLVVCGWLCERPTAGSKQASLLICCTALPSHAPCQAGAAHLLQAHVQLSVAVKHSAPHLPVLTQARLLQEHTGEDALHEQALAAFDALVKDMTRSYLLELPPGAPYLHLSPAVLLRGALRTQGTAVEAGLPSGPGAVLTVPPGSCEAAAKLSLCKACLHLPLSVAAAQGCSVLSLAIQGCSVLSLAIHGTVCTPIRLLACMHCCMEAALAGLFNSRQPPLRPARCRRPAGGDPVPCTLCAALDGSGRWAGGGQPRLAHRTGEQAHQCAPCCQCQCPVPCTWQLCTHSAQTEQLYERVFVGAAGMVAYALAPGKQR